MRLGRRTGLHACLGHVPRHDVDRRLLGLPQTHHDARHPHAKVSEFAQYVVVDAVRGGLRVHIYT